MNKKIVGSLVLIAAACVLVAAAYNSLIRSNEAANTAWAQVQNAYQRRFDLVLNLVETVKGYAAHEKSTFTEVTEARSSVSRIAIIFSSTVSFLKMDGSCDKYPIPNCARLCMGYCATSR